MSRHFRVASLAVAAVIAVPALSACDTSPGAAALVGNKEITTGELQSAVNTSLTSATVRSTVLSGASTAAARAGFARATLARLISDRVLDAIAAEHHITVTSQDISAQRSSALQQLGSESALDEAAAQQYYVAPSQLDDLFRSFALKQAIVNAIAAEQPTSQAQLQAEYQKDIDQYDKLDIAQIAVSKQKLADKLLHKVQAHPSSFGTLAKKYSEDTSTSSNGGLIGAVPRSQVVSLLPKKTKATPGSFFAAPVSSGKGFVVIHIIKRERQPLSQVEGQVKQAIYASEGQSLLTKATNAEAAKLGVHVNPRYGAWDSKTQSVVATKSATSATG